MLGTMAKLIQEHTRRNRNYTKTENSLFSLITTVIRFIFIVKIFSYTENVQKYFTRI